MSGRIESDWSHRKARLFPRKPEDIKCIEYVSRFVDGIEKGWPLNCYYRSFEHSCHITIVRHKIIHSTICDYWYNYYHLNKDHEYDVNIEYRDKIIAKYRGLIFRIHKNIIINGKIKITNIPQIPIEEMALLMMDFIPINARKTKRLIADKRIIYIDSIRGNTNAEKLVLDYSDFDSSRTQHDQ